MKHIKLIIYIFFFIILRDTVVLANDQINVVENYLNNINNLVANFIQVAPDGTESSGKFFLSRPGKLRWQYNPPVPTLIIINNNLLTHYDYDLDQVSHTKAEDNLVSILTRKNIKFGTDVLVKNIQEQYGNISIKLYRKNNQDEGEIEITFNKSPIIIKKIEITDSMNQLTSIFFNDIQNDLSLDKNLFILKNPKYFKNERL